MVFTKSVLGIEGESVVELLMVTEGEDVHEKVLVLVTAMPTVSAGILKREAVPAVQ